MTTNTKAHAKLLRVLARDYDRAVTAEENAPTLAKAWRLAAASERALRRLEAARAGLPLPEPKMVRSPRNLAKMAFAALAQLGRSVARALQAEAALRKARVASALANAARKAAKLARKALRAVVGTVARLALRARGAQPTASDAVAQLAGQAAVAFALRGVNLFTADHVGF
jgi:hypothetical protein